MAIITLYRGTRNAEETNNIIRNNTAGGAIANQNPRIPLVDNPTIIDQKVTGGECLPTCKNIVFIPEYVEYTSDINKAAGFAARKCNCRGMPLHPCDGRLVTIEIDEQYVLKMINDEAEDGYFIYSSTPVRVATITKIGLLYE